jgi:alpha-L-fucosidase
MKKYNFISFSAALSKFGLAIATSCFLGLSVRTVSAQTVKGEHNQIGNAESKKNNLHNQHPDAQWFPDAGLGLFIHWDQASTREWECSWPMMAGRGPNWGIESTRKKGPKEYWKNTSELTKEQIDSIVRTKDYGQGKDQVTPTQYFALANEFNPNNFHPEVWLKKAKNAGFKYAVFTTKHHSGFAMWPSAYGNFSTINSPMRGRDLVKEYVTACRAAGLKVGLYFSVPDWHFNREFQNFLYSYTDLAKKHPEIELDADHNLRTKKHTPEEIETQKKAFLEMVRGQLTELLTKYGKIDVLWFDGGLPFSMKGYTAMTVEQIRKLQPGIVMNGRMFGTGDFISPEGTLKDDIHLKADEWGEFCCAWGNGWAYTGWNCRPLNSVLTNLVRSRAAGLNNLLDLGPKADGELSANLYENIDKLSAWMKINSESIYDTRALQGDEKASVPASSKGNIRYLYLIAEKSNKMEAVDRKITISGLQGKNYKAQMLGKTGSLKVISENGIVTVEVPKESIGETVGVLKLLIK